jgi:hypothetical protein
MKRRMLLLLLISGLAGCLRYTPVHDVASLDWTRDILASVQR